MNKARRKQISELSTAISGLISELNNEDPEISWPDTKGKISDFHDTAESIHDDEDEYYNNMPESLQGGDKGEASQNATSNLSTAMDKLEEATTAADDDTPDLEEVTNALQEAVDSLDEAEAC